MVSLNYGEAKNILYKCGWPRIGGDMQFDVRDGQQPWKDDWFRNGQVPHTGKEAYHTMFHAYPSLESLREKSSPWEYSLNGEWKFRYCRDMETEAEKMAAPTYDDRDWDAIAVPSCWQDRRYGVETPLYVNVKTPFYKKKSDICPPHVPDEANSMGIYRRTFLLPPSFCGRHTILSMAGVESAVNIWINGYFVGFSQGSFSPVEWDITEYLEEKGQNTICCQVYRYSGASFLEDQDMWRLAGIFRSVMLISRPDVGIFDFKIETELDAAYRDAKLKIMVVLRNRSRYMQDAHEVEAQLEAPCGTDVEGLCARGFTGMENPDWPANSWRGMPSFSKPIFGNSIRSVYLNLSVKEPLKWTAETPVLYHIRLTLKTEDGQVVETVRWPVGFRQIEVKDGKICVNGRRVILKGVNYHEFSPRWLRAVTEEEMIRDICLMKQNHINTVRNAHYPHASRWYELCDEYGLYVMDEADMESHDISYKDDVLPGNDMRYTGICLDRISAMVLTAQNYPPVVIWSLGNEMGYGKNVEFMAGYCRSMDATRLIHKRQMSVVADMDSDTYPSVEWIETRALQNPKRPFLMNEYAHAMGNAMGNLQEYWEAVARFSALAGGYIWEWCDHGILDKNRKGQTIFAYGSDYPAFYQDENFCIDGVVLPDRRETAKLAEVNAVYRWIRAELLNEERGIVRLYNDHSHVGMDIFRLGWTLEKDGAVVEEGRKETLSAPSGGWEDVDLHMKQRPADGSIYTLNLFFMRKEPVRWAPEGFIDTRIQLRLDNNGAGARKANVYGGGQLRIREEGECLLFDGTCPGKRRFFLEISAENGWITRLQYGQDDRNWNVFQTDGGDFSFPPMELQVYRAPTDNDRHSPSAIGENGWLKMGLDQMEHTCEVCQVAERADDSCLVKIHHLYRCAGEKKGGFHQYILLRIWADGRISMEFFVQPFGELETLPRMGVRFPLRTQLDRVDYFGLGPKENYPDRKSGAYLGRFEIGASQMGEFYVRPQENGSRGEVTYAAVTDVDGYGILTAGSRPFAFSLQPYSARQLSQARHAQELVREPHDILSVDWERNGLGNSSCGTDVMEKYRLLPTESRFLLELAPFVPGQDPFATAVCRGQEGELERHFQVDHSLSIEPEERKAAAPFDPSDFIERLKAGFRQ